MTKLPIPICFYMLETSVMKELIVSEKCKDKNMSLGKQCSIKSRWLRFPIEGSRFMSSCFVFFTRNTTIPLYFHSVFDRLISG